MTARSGPSRLAALRGGGGAPPVERRLGDAGEVAHVLAVLEAPVRVVQPAREHVLVDHDLAQTRLARAGHPVDELAHAEVLAERADARERVAADQERAKQVARLEAFRALDPSGGRGVEVRVHELLDVTENEVRRGVLRQRGELELELARRPQVVRVEEGDQLTGRQLDGAVARRAYAGVRLRVHPNPWCVAPGQGGGRV